MELPKLLTMEKIAIAIMAVTLPALPTTPKILGTAMLAGLIIIGYNADKKAIKNIIRETKEEKKQ